MGVIHVQYYTYHSAIIFVLQLHIISLMHTLKPSDHILLSALYACKCPF